MAKVYRYIDMRDNLIKYVGIVYGENRTLEQRHKEHLKKMFGVMKILKFSIWMYR